MKELRITANDSGRRLDRFLRKYLKNASLGEIYKIIRKDVKVDGARRDEAYILKEGEVLTLYVSDEALASMTGSQDNSRGDSPGKIRHKALKQFKVIYEDPNILIADKPYGLLTHGDRQEKKHHLANQVRDYLIERGEFDPVAEKVFSPAPANRIDRNTTGVVLFGKTSPALQALNKAIREDGLDKFYTTIVHGTLGSEMTLEGYLTKDEKSNRVTVSSEDAGGEGSRARDIITIVRPLEILRYGNGYTATLAEVRLVTGRPHQIRAHLASEGHPIIGDSKYQDAASRRANEYIQRRWKLSSQLLHASRIEFGSMPEHLAYLEGKAFSAPLPANFSRILGEMRRG